MRKMLKGKKQLTGTPSRLKRIIIGVVGSLALSAALWIPLYALPTIKLPEPTGPYAIGVANYNWVDRNRIEPFTHDGYREVAARIWYPASMKWDLQRAPYAYDSQQLQEITKEQPLYALFGSLMSARTHSYESAIVAPDLARYPVLLMSPGYGMSSYMYTSFTEEMASHGYIVVAVEHSYFSILPAFSAAGQVRKGMVELDPFDWPSMAADTQNRVEDMKFALGQLERINGADPQSILNGKLDLQRIGAFGHSGGGAVAMQLLSQDGRVSAAVQMDGFPYGQYMNNGLAKPFMYMLEPSNEAFASKSLSESVWSDPSEYPGLLTIEDYHREAEEVSRRMKGIFKHGGTKWIVPEAHHFSFTDLTLIAPLLFPPNMALQNDIKKNLLHFFDEQFKGVSGGSTVQAAG
ncbi:alpha/beta hydrolase family protein [Paenibacillus sp. MMS18-CY102]|uniref:alpha/beta hydrolase family protein n=1 Tax=Paenibacillus sp. MMS18-CY102 TaxID=2682849 RepID=UPI00136593A5|nr:hypothetical protein [Paenibacillus sp. MMS18-CY102]MWC29222.1 hypothetical protein [Paenibacillus sp. MMS18-CY102]